MTSFRKREMHMETLKLKEKIDNLKENCRKSDISQLKYRLKIIKSDYNKYYKDHRDANNQNEIFHDISEASTTKNLIDIMESKLEAAGGDTIATSGKSTISTHDKYHRGNKPKDLNQKSMWNFLSCCCK